jgi:small subunit ribosomal protein S5
MIKATFEALKNVRSPRAVAVKRGKKVPEIFGRAPGEAEGAKA